MRPSLWSASETGWWIACPQGTVTYSSWWIWVYELVRSLEATHPDELPRAERVVVEALIEASRHMYP